MTIFPNLEEVIFQIKTLFDKWETVDLNKLKEIKRQYWKKYWLSQLPSNIQLLKLYQKLIEENKIAPDQRIFSLLRKRHIRSQSWIVPVQVLMMPWHCPWKCIFCPNDPSMPKSYINTEPGAMRALLNQFDPIKQVWNRLLSLTLTWHPIDKIEMIVLWWTFDAYPKDYKVSFIKWLYDACNTFQQFLSQVEIKDLNPKAARFTIDYDKLDIQFASSLEEAQKINETAWSRVVGLTIETRPEFATDQNARFWRQLWVTRIEIGVQSLFDDVLEANKRWHTVEQIAKAFHKLRQYGFKISAHFMPGLYGSCVEKDIQTMEKAYSQVWFKPDEIKFYPTSVIPNTELYELWKSWKYKPITAEQIKYIVNEIKDRIIPPYTRIKRLIRDIPSTEIAAWTDITNLRQLVLEERREELKKIRRNIRRNSEEKSEEYLKNGKSEEVLKKVWRKSEEKSEESLKKIITEDGEKITEDKGRLQKIGDERKSEENLKKTWRNKSQTIKWGIIDDKAGNEIRGLEYEIDKWIKFFQRLYEGLQGVGSVKFEESSIDLDIEKLKKFLEKDLAEDEILTYLLLADADKKQIDLFKKLLQTKDFWLAKRNFVCMCTRCREIRNAWRKSEEAITDNPELYHRRWENHRWLSSQVVLVVRKYLSSVGEEYFISFEDGLGYLYGFVRLLLPAEDKAVDWEGLGPQTAIVRELHVYWQQAKIGTSWEVQHRWFGRRLMQMAEFISRLKWYKALSVISGVGVRPYYENLGYRLQGTYMVKSFEK